MTAADEPVGATVEEFSGVATSSALDASVNTGGGGTTVTAPSVTTTTAGDLVVVAADTTGPVTVSPGGPWTDITGPSNADTPIAWQSGVAADTYNTAWTETPSGSWATVGLALKAATVPGVTQTLTSGCTALGYDNDNRLTATQYPGGATENITHLPSGLVATIGAVTSTGATITHDAYNYTTAATPGTDTMLVQSRVENDPSTSGTNLTTTYTYDRLNRVVSAVATSGTSYYYSYDADGNRTCAQTTGTCTATPYTYNTLDELTAGPAGTYTYDADGNETSSPQLTGLAYNTKNQTSAVTPAGSGTQNYSYTGADSTERTTAGIATFAPNGIDIYQTTTSGTASYDTYDADGNLIGERVGGVSYYYLHDNIGTILAVITATGTTSDRYTYDPYGTRTTTTSGIANPWGYASGYTDTTTGLTKFGARYYDPTTARWTQLDPTGQNPGYVYVGDDAVNELDPSGSDAICINDRCGPTYGGGESFSEFVTDVSGAAGEVNKIAGAVFGAKCLGTAGAYGGSYIGPEGTVAGGVAGAGVGGFLGYNNGFVGAGGLSPLVYCSLAGA